MKKVCVSILGVLLTASLVVGCASTKKVAGSSEWWHNERQAARIASEEFGEPALGAVGISTLSSAVAEKSARADGRAALAQQLEAVVLNEINRSAGQEKGDEDTETYKEQAKVIANSALSGSAQVAYYYDEKEGRTYVLMGLPLEGLDKKIQSAAMKSNNKIVRDALKEITAEQVSAGLEEIKNAEE